MSLFSGLPEAAPDAAFSLVQVFKSDPSPLKVDLSPGFYRDEDAQPWVLPSVHKAKQALLPHPVTHHEHSPIQGHLGLLQHAQKLVFDVSGEDAATIASVQTVAGTGANHLGALFLAQASRPRTVWISKPTWINHDLVWRLVDKGIERRTYDYYNPETFSVNFESIISTLKSEAAEGDVVVLHGCGHNPTGIDFTKDQWKAVADVCQQKKLIPFFDLAYQGFVSGDVAEDAWAVRHFFRNTPLEILVAQSFSKNFGLYGERVGALHVACGTRDAKDKVVSLLSQLSRAKITTAPINGAKIVAQILGDQELEQQWHDDLAHMTGRMRSMRERLVDTLRKQQTPGNWDHILSDVGMFSMTGLQPHHIRLLQEEHHVYLLPSGRVSMTGLTESNVEYVARAFHQVLTGTARNGEK